MLPFSANAAYPAITASTTWSNGYTLADSQSITSTNGTQENPIVITVTGTVTVEKAISITGTGYVIFTGGGTIKKTSTLAAGNMFSISGGNVTFENITLDGDNISANGVAIASSNASVTVNINEGAIIKNFVNAATAEMSSCLFLLFL
jgi:hypothetical protein